MSIFAGHNAQVAMAMVIDHPFISDFGTCCECFKSTLLTDLIDVFRVISGGVDRDQTHEEKNWPMEQSPANLMGLNGLLLGWIPDSPDPADQLQGNPCEDSC